MEGRNYRLESTTRSISTSKLTYERMGPVYISHNFLGFRTRRTSLAASDQPGGEASDGHVSDEFKSAENKRLRCFKGSFRSPPTRSVNAIGNMSFGAILIIARPVLNS